MNDGRSTESWPDIETAEVNGLWSRSGLLHLDFAVTGSGLLSTSPDMSRATTTDDTERQRWGWKRRSVRDHSWPRDLRQRRVHLPKKRFFKDLVKSRPTSYIFSSKRTERPETIGKVGQNGATVLSDWNWINVGSMLVFCTRSDIIPALVRLM